MTAGFHLGGEVFWGTNGAVEAYVEGLAEESAARFGSDDRLARFFRGELSGFFPGKVVFLDEVLVDGAARERLLELFDAATRRLLDEDVFTEVGRAWVETTVRALRARLAEP